ncbi:Undecaprenyl-phosphate galactose phosphotransferase [Stanieria cyanosphaera PCC 7437]|uniref:Undecaprenyl-phosphate galactose phosphotransferase n=1 Tax=Stanieria cyanosphaera (strain ATCC 29371 / PCC 7437) TaxID=111780 RepID=K9XQK3_STAC7|nr:heterocyst development glycosyltransferase HepC [Stanieria cyanosphaera]AFZ34369.1 Undecaprenyl-phosphate galactose phosphotransferase [Stanieria cyanosphaera PCC 7437]
MTANILLTTSKVLTLDLDNPQTEKFIPACRLKWRKKILWVTKVSDDFKPIPALTRQQWLQDCLNNSWVKTVCLDYSLEEKAIRVWADTCRKAKKKVFLRINSSYQILNRYTQVCWQIKRIFDWVSAAILLLLLSPLMLAIAFLVKLSSPGKILFRQWRVGKRGQLFQIYKFRTMKVDAEQQHHQVMGDLDGLHKLEKDPRITPLGKWLRKYSLDELPQLFNVLRGEMSLVGPRPWALYDALRLREADKKRLNALPGITGAWQVKSRSQLLDLNAVTKCDLEYLHSWSLIGDLKILMLTIPKVISGFGAY